ncbi:hypothetical protein EDD11_005430 [Mortierella claussenii]|nr:hypothetical protein EDD11_005430 [Mortierella claussenii]
MDPRKLKVNELKEQLQLAGLSVNGKKEELVARLLEHQKAEEEAVAVGGPPTGTGDAFEWDESKFDIDDLAPPSDSVTSTEADATKTTTTSASAAQPTASTAESAKPAAATTNATGSASTSTLPSSSAGATGSASNVGSVQFQGNVSDTETLKAEFEKRKQRAARFGIPLKEEDKAVERAARFGVPVTATATASLAKAAGTPVKTTTPLSKGLPNKPGTVSVHIPDEVLKKRQERFGNQEPVAGSTTTAAGKKATAVVDSAEEEKKRKRALKFGLVAKLLVYALGNAS